MPWSRTNSFSAGSVRDEDFYEEPYMEPEDDREASWLDRQTVERRMALDTDVDYTNIAVLTPAALREAEATRDRGRHQHNCDQHTSARRAASTVQQHHLPMKIKCQAGTHVMVIADSMHL